LRRRQIDVAPEQAAESHSRHHARGVHYANFSDLPLFDILFGTFHNPSAFFAETGFYHGASRRVAEMLRFRDVSLPARRVRRGNRRRDAGADRRGLNGDSSLCSISNDSCSQH
jgi:hypothetical protein